MTEKPRDNVGIGVTRRSYNTIRKQAKKQGISMRKLVDELVKDPRSVTWLE